MAVHDLVEPLEAVLRLKADIEIDRGANVLVAQELANRFIFARERPQEDKPDQMAEGMRVQMISRVNLDELGDLGAKRGFGLLSPIPADKERALIPFTLQKKGTINLEIKVQKGNRCLAEGEVQILLVFDLIVGKHDMAHGITHPMHMLIQIERREVAHPHRGCLKN